MFGSAFVRSCNPQVLEGCEVDDQVYPEAHISRKSEAKTQRFLFLTGNLYMRVITIGVSIYSALPSVHLEAGRGCVLSSDYRVTTTGSTT